MKAISDRAFRRSALLLWVPLLLLPMAYWVWIRMNFEVGYWLCVEDPPACEGTPLVLSLFRVDRVLGPDEYVAEKGMKYVPVVGDTTGLHAGQDISVGGTFRAADQKLIQEWREVHHLRWHKKALGIVGLGALALALPLWFGIRRDGLVVRG